MVETEPPYQLAFDERSEYLFARVAADKINSAAALHYLAEISQKCNEVGATHLMVVRDIPIMLSDPDLYYATSGFQQMIGSRKVAFVNPHREIREDMKFALIIGLNRGGRFNVFDTEEEAERWLIE